MTGLPPPYMIRSFISRVNVVGVATLADVCGCGCDIRTCIGEGAAGSGCGSGERHQCPVHGVPQVVHDRGG